MTMPELDSALHRENTELRAALREQFEAAHAEMCGWAWPHDGSCYWEPPSVLLGAVE